MRFPSRLCCNVAMPVTKRYSLALQIRWAGTVPWDTALGRESAHCGRRNSVRFWNLGYRRDVRRDETKKPGLPTSIIPRVE